MLAIKQPTICSYLDGFRRSVVPPAAYDVLPVLLYCRSANRTIAFVLLEPIYRLIGRYLLKCKAPLVAVFVTVHFKIPPFLALRWNAFNAAAILKMGQSSDLIAAGVQRGPLPSHVAL